MLQSLSPLVESTVQAVIKFLDEQMETLIYSGMDGWEKDCELNFLPGYQLLAIAALTNCALILLSNNLP